MSQVLLIEKNESLRLIIKLNAVKMLGVEVVERERCADAVSLIEILPDIDLIICREKMVGSFDVVSTLESGNLAIPLLWIGQIKPSYINTRVIAPDSSWEKIVDESAKFLGIKVSDNQGGDTSGYEAIDCRYFLNINSKSLGCDVYLKLKKDGHDHYVKCLHAEDSFTKADIEKYIQSGLKEFHVPKAYFVQFVNFVTNQFVSRLDEENLAGPARISVTGEAFKISKERIESIGLDDYAVNVVEASIKSMTSSISESNALGNFLKLMKTNNLSYGYANAYLISLILHKVVPQFEWGSKSVREKLTHAAFFHNFTLKEEKMMRIQSTAELTLADLSTHEKDLVMNHALQSALLIEKFPSIPEGVSTIIKEHHGAKNGIGFPEALGTAISPISMVFIVVEAFVDEFLQVSERPTKADFEKIHGRLSARFTHHIYAQTVKALDDMIFKRNT